MGVTKYEYHRMLRMEVGYRLDPNIYLAVIKVTENKRFDKSIYSLNSTQLRVTVITRTPPELNLGHMIPTDRTIDTNFVNCN